MKQLFLLFAAFALLGGLVFLGALQADAETEKKQAVCNVSPNKEGKYDKDGCETAFNAFPPGAICPLGETATIGTCTVNSDACTNSASKIGMWCTCTYTCAKKMAVDLE